MLFELPPLDELSAAIVDELGAAEAAAAVARLVELAAAQGVTLSPEALYGALEEGTPFSTTVLSEGELAGDDDALPKTFGKSCGNSTYGHTCCASCAGL